MNLAIEGILVPQGPEYQAVRRGLNPMNLTTDRPLVIPIPVGPEALKPFLEQWLITHNQGSQALKRILLMGVGGSLSSQLQVGDVAIYQTCSGLALNTAPFIQPCDRGLTQAIEQHLGSLGKLVTGLSCEHLIWSAQEKQQLAQRYGASVVDMEGEVTLKVLGAAGIAVAMVRVISDDCYHDLPNVNAALSPNGQLQAWPLAVGMMRSPMAALRLIRGSLVALSVLAQTTQTLFEHKT